MNMISELAARFREEESGAAMVEYTILLGLIAAASILAILAVGGWVSGRWTGLCGNLDAHGGGTCNATSGAGT